MKKRIVNWFKGHKILGVMAPSIIALLLICVVVVPYAQAATYLTVTGTYNVSCRPSVKYLDNNERHPALWFDTLTITTQTKAYISAATLTWSGGDISLTGFVGTGSRARISLSGSDSTTGTTVVFNGQVQLRSGSITGITGTIDGVIKSDGSRWDDSADGTAAISSAQANGGYYSALLTAGDLANPEAVIFHMPSNNFTLKNMTTLSSGTNGISFYYYASQATNGPQMMLRFAPKGSTTMSYYGGGTSGLVDITIMPLQSGAVTTTWTKYTVTKDSAICGYYGNDPVDYHSIDGGFGGENYKLSEIEAAINAEAVMVGHAASASDWVLTMVDVELWEGGARTCYVDDVQIGRYTYSLEPAYFSGSFKGTKQ